MRQFLPKSTVMPGCFRGLLAALFCLACGEAGDGAAIEAGEELPGGAATARAAFGVNAFLRPIDDLPRERRAEFFGGDSFFSQAWVQPPSSTSSRDGLGPLFNARSCSTCHPQDGRGKPPEAGEAGFGGLLLRLSVPGRAENGGSVPEPSYGGQLQPLAVAGVAPEASFRIEYEPMEGEYADGEAFELLDPSYVIEDLAYGEMAAGVMVSPRVGPAMIGLGLLEAIPEERLLELSDPDDQDADGISGRVNRVWSVAQQQPAVGRFGWKAEQPSLREQAAGAFLGDLGVTSSLFPDPDCSPLQADCLAHPNGGEPELSDRLLGLVESYSRLLAVPGRQQYDTPEVLDGKRLFRSFGCSDCHTPSHRTGEGMVEQLSDQLIWPYTDLLLHDMGEGLADGRPSFEANGNEWRTPPLWGIGRYQGINGHERLLHDGRARGVAEAVLWHGGEAEASREAFRSASASERDALVRFVRSL